MNLIHLTRIQLSYLTSSSIYAYFFYFSNPTPFIKCSHFSRPPYLLLSLPNLQSKEFINLVSTLWQDVPQNRSFFYVRMHLNMSEGEILSRLHDPCHAGDDITLTIRAMKKVVALGSNT